MEIVDPPNAKLRCIGPKLGELWGVEFHNQKNSTNTLGGFKHDVMWHEMTINELVRWYLSATKPHRHIRRAGPNAYIAHAVMTPPETTVGTPASHCKALPPALDGPQISLSLSHTHMYIYIYIQAYTSSKYLIVYVVVFFLNTPHLWQIWRCSTIFSLLSHYWNDWSAWVQSLVVWLFGPSMCSEKYERSMEKKDQEWFTMT